ncbi:pilus (MSHA type) biogenesis protein MshL [Sulfuriferula nivalis]|uniref:Pilus (MSHA type) biogenesis protein MshL n=1 Tax=Sulfuriferula nivalis TaxID=2675298 RepID=A0A809SEF5_9PROT|nr:pilus (MSHA type) biogenesis protein MshL [Sulfuriferula nivalis]BBP01377.1 pilus (MSHA type) biogenesis protein MshL [Sulfuriferula nivalis]
MNNFRLLILTSALLSLTGCATLGIAPKPDTTQARINTELSQAVDNKQQANLPPAAVSAALLPPLQIAMPKSTKPLEQRFDLVINNAPANQVFMGIVTGTHYSMLIPPDLTGNLSVNLKNVTVFEALDAIRELYGYDYKVDGSRIYIQPMSMQTRVFKLNYIAGQRKGTSDIRVTSGSVGDTPAIPSGVAGAMPTTTTPGATNGHSLETSKITTNTESDFWSDLKTSLTTIVGDKDGRNIVVSPQSGVVLIHAMPSEIHQVENYLKAMQLAVDRSVMLEAKIIEVQLSDGFQTGINWSAFNRYGQSRFSVGADPNSLTVPGGAPIANSTLGSVFSAGMSTAMSTTAGALNIAAQSDNFAALLNFLGTQGTSRVLSSPRIATLNNQMAILKVGTDDFFVTNVSSTSSATSTGTTATPNVTLRPFFSGIALDVTPQISEEGEIILHIHPSVSKVSENYKVIDLGTSGILKLPLASSTISETDSVVRVQDGSIVAIGGLMRENSTDDKSEVPGLGGIPVIGSLFKHTNRASQKSELVILLKTTVLKSSNDWAQDVLQTRDRIEGMQRGGSQ